MRRHCSSRSANGRPQSGGNKLHRAGLVRGVHAQMGRKQRTERRPIVERKSQHRPISSETSQRHTLLPGEPGKQGSKGGQEECIPLCLQGRTGPGNAIQLLLAKSIRRLSQRVGPSPGEAIHGQVAKQVRAMACSCPTLRHPSACAGCRRLVGNIDRPRRVSTERIRH